MEILLICALLVMLFINIAWFICLKNTVEAMEAMGDAIEAGSKLIHTLANDMIERKMKENQKLKERNDELR